MFQPFIHSVCFLLLFSKTDTNKQVLRGITGNVMDRNTENKTGNGLRQVLFKTFMFPILDR